MIALQKDRIKSKTALWIHVSHSVNFLLVSVTFRRVPTGHGRKLPVTSGLTVVFAGDSGFTTGHSQFRRNMAEKSDDKRNSKSKSVESHP